MNRPAWPDGVAGFDHTADVGLVVRAGTRARLFDRAAAGMVALVAGAEEGATTVARRPSPVRGGAGSAGSGRAPVEASTGPEQEVALAAPDLEVLLVAWLREILHLLQDRGLQYAGARFETLTETRLAAHVRLVAAPAPAMELKGVTYHALAVRREGNGWIARVVFDI